MDEQYNRIFSIGNVRGSIIKRLIRIPCVCVKWHRTIRSLQGIWFISIKIAQSHREQITMMKQINDIIKETRQCIIVHMRHIKYGDTGWPSCYRKYILQITQPSQYGYAKFQYRFAVTSGSPSKYHACKTIIF